MLSSLVRARFPPLACAFGYGSGVFKQASSSSSSSSLAAGAKMIDTIFVVDDAAQWHEANVLRNPADYSFAARHLMSSRAIAHVQQQYGGKIWFNTLVPLEQDNNSTLLLKYGVVSKTDLLNDLLLWDTFYLAGRLQKPVLELDCEGSFQAELHGAMLVNRQRAYQLCHNQDDQEDEEEMALYERIVALSYAGDVRVGVAESPTKTRDIVAGALDSFREVYRPIIGAPPLLSLPLPPAYSACSNREQVLAQLRSTIRRTSAVQTVKGLLTAGPGKSATYALAKLGKRWTR